MKRVPVRFESGPDFFCPDCRRWLARANPTGTFDLAWKAAISARVAVSVEELAGDAPPPDDFVGLIVEAECHLRRCRLQRWWRSRTEGGWILQIASHTIRRRPRHGAS